MELNQNRYPVITTYSLPEEYARHALPGHQIIVQQGDFGLLITQVLRQQDYTAAVYYFNLNSPVSLRIKPAAPCLLLYYAIKNKGTIILDETLSVKVIIEERSHRQLNLFQKRYPVHFKAGVYRSLQITIPRGDGQQEGPEKLNEILDRYLEEMGAYIPD